MHRTDNHRHRHHLAKWRIGGTKIGYTVHAIRLLTLSLFLAGSVATAQRPAGPVRVSDNGRYFVDQRGRPVFWLGTTQWQLVPDQSIFTISGRTQGRVLNLAARHKDGKWVMVYLGSTASSSINMDKVAAPNGKVNARWTDPETSDSTRAGGFPNTSTQSFSHPMVGKTRC